MNIFPKILILIFLTPLWSHSQTPTPTPTAVNDDVVKISTTLIQIDANFTDSKGNQLNDIRRDEVEIYENGKKQEITTFKFVAAKPRKNKIAKNEEASLLTPPRRLLPSQIRRTIALVVDDITLSFASIHFVRKALKDFVDNQMQEGDLVAIIRTRSGIGALQQFTSDKRQLYAAIEKVRWKWFGFDRINAFAPIRAEPAAGADADSGDDTKDESTKADNNVDDLREDVFVSGTLGAVSYIVGGMRELPGRKSIMLLSDGFRLNRQDSLRFSESTGILDALMRLIDQANRASVVIYTMDAKGLQTGGFTASDNTGYRSGPTLDRILQGRRRFLRNTQDGLIVLANETGGIAVINNNDLIGGIRRMLNDQSYYLIGYQPDDEVFDPSKRRFNNLDLKVNREGVRVRYRSGFFGVSDEKMSATPEILTGSEKIVRALTSPFAVNDLTLSLNTIFKGDAKNKLSVNSFVHIPINQLEFTVEPGGARKATFDLLAMNFGDGGIPTDKISKTFTVFLKADEYERLQVQGIVYSLVFPIKKAGAFQMRVAIRDHESEKVGSASQFIEIPKLKKKRLSLSGLMLDNVSYKEWNETAGVGVKIQTKENSASHSSTPAADTALRKFANGSVLKYGLEIYNSSAKRGQLPQLEIQTLLYRDGKVIFEGKTNPIEVTPDTNIRVIPVSGAINLGSKLSAGDYALQVIITDKLAKKKRQTATQFVQFEITN